MLLAGCSAAGGGGGTVDDGDAGRVAAQALSRAAIRITPLDGAADVPATGPLTVAVDDGTLQQVGVADAAGVPLPGRITDGGRAWRPQSELALGTRYTVDVVAVDARGRRAARHAEFTTLVPRHRFIGYYSPEQGMVVGTGMIVSVVFSRAITERAAVERAIRVTAEPAVPVAAHWFGARRLDFRPQHLWAPGTEVDLRLRLRDVRGAPDAYGMQDKDVRFTVGRSQISTVEADTHTMTVRRGGRVVRVLPVSAGGPQHPTYGGIMVITEKLPVTRMNGDTVGYGGEYNIPDVPHAMRLTRSGTFVHGNYWSPPGVFGTANTSHGCVGLYDTKRGGPGTPAGWFYGASLIGDIVQVAGAHDPPVAPDNGLGGWNLSWRQWLAGSALR